LAEAEMRSAGLPELVELADRLSSEVACFTAAAVHDARAAGASWSEVAQATGVSAERARARWSTDRVKRLLRRRERQEPQPSAAVAVASDVVTSEVSPAAKLAAALSYLQRASQLSVAEAARQADLSPSYVSRILAGERLPAWPVVHMLATIFGGSAADLRLLWERAHGPAAGPRRSLEAAAGRLHSALRGLHLAAACPSPDALSQGSALSPGTVSAVLAGEQIPDWTTTAALVARLNASPAELRPVWEDVHYAFLASMNGFPAGGLLKPAGSD
jgi:AraC-like DNA-binding protein